MDNSTYYDVFKTELMFLFIFIIWTLFTSFRRKKAKWSKMMSFKFTDSEVEVLILIFEGWKSEEIAKLKDMPIDDFYKMFRELLKKTHSKTWEELKIIGSQLSHALDRSLHQALDQDCETGTLFEVGTKEIFQYLIDQAEQTLKQHKETCLNCRIALRGLQMACPDQKRLSEKILEWTGNRNIFEAREAKCSQEPHA